MIPWPRKLAFLLLSHLVFLFIWVFFWGGNFFLGRIFGPKCITPLQMTSRLPSVFIAERISRGGRREPQRRRVGIGHAAAPGETASAGYAPGKACKNPFCSFISNFFLILFLCVKIHIIFFGLNFFINLFLAIGFYFNYCFFYYLIFPHVSISFHSFNLFWICTSNFFYFFLFYLIFFIFFSLILMQNVIFFLKFFFFIFPPKFGVAKIHKPISQFSADPTV